MAGAPVCDDPGIAEPPSIEDVHARLAALRKSAPRGAAGGPGGATSSHIEAMQESMEILTNPEMARRVRAGRAAVASADVVELEELGGSAPVPGQCRVALTGPVAGQLAQLSEPSATEVRELLGEVARSPTDGRALGMGMVGVWSARGGPHRLLYAIQQEPPLVIVLSLDAP